MFVCILVILTGVRDMIGGYDVYVYADLYESDWGEMYSMGYEKLFIYFYEILRLFSDDRHFMFFIASLIIYSSYYYVLRENSFWLGPSIFLLFSKFYLMFFVYLRQGLSMALVVIGCHFLLNKQKTAALILTIAAIFMHQSAIIFVPFIFLSESRFSRQRIMFLFSFMLVISLSPLSQLLFSSIANGVGSEKILGYSNQGKGINYLYSIEGLLVLGLCYKFKERFYKSKRLLPIFNGLVYYGLLVCLGIANATFVRLSWYYFIFVCLALPKVILFISNPVVRRRLQGMMYIYFVTLFLRLLLSFDGGDFIPYKSIFDDRERVGKWDFMEYR